MRYYKLFLWGMCLVMLLNSCQAFSEKQHIINMFPSQQIKSQLNPSILWSVAIGKGVGDFYSRLHPEYANGIVYAADRQGFVKAINANNGQEVWSINLSEKSQWSFDVPALLSGGISVSNNRVYVGSEKAKIYVLNSSNGGIIWTANVSGEILSCPIIDSEGVLIHTSNDQLHMLNKDNGNIKWTISFNTSEISIRGESTPTTIFDLGVVGSNNGFVNVVSLQKGTIVWQKYVTQSLVNTTTVSCLVDVDTTPVVVDNIIYTLSYHNLTALNLYTGSIVWQRNFGSTNNFIIINNYIYFVDKKNRLVVVNKQNGETVWIQEKLFNRDLTEPVLYRNSLVVGDNQGYIHWINLENGCFLAQMKIDRSGFFSKPIVVNEKLFIQTRSGILYAITS